MSTYQDIDGRRQPPILTDVIDFLVSLETYETHTVDVYNFEESVFSGIVFGHKLGRRFKLWNKPQLSMKPSMVGQ